MHTYIHYITLRYTTLHYITLIHAYIHTYILEITDNFTLSEEIVTTLLGASLKLMVRTDG